MAKLIILFSVSKTPVKASPSVSAVEFSSGLPEAPQHAYQLAAVLA
jgi:hypothetical protein